MPKTRERNVSRKVCSVQFGSRVVEHRGQPFRQADAFVELPQGQQTGVGRERCLGHLDPDGQRLEEVELEQSNR
jgi:hypothetical protein